MGRFLLAAIGALNIIAALAFIGCGVCANVSDSRRNQDWKVEVNGKRVADEKMLQEHLSKKVPGYPAVKIAGIVAGYGVCVGLILSGVALFFGRLWGKLLAAGIFALAFFHHLVFIVYQLVWVHPAIASFFDAIPRPAIFGPAIVGQGVEAIITTQSWVARFPGYVSIAWWAAGCLFYLVATPIVLFAPTSSGDAEEDKAPIRKSRRDKDEDEDEEETSSRKPRRRDDDDDDAGSFEDDDRPRRRRR